MNRAIATTCLAAIALAAAPRALPAQTEPGPAAPAASAAPLPEIGRTRATSAACAAMRDVVIPAFAASRRADHHAATVRTELPVYVQLKANYKSQQDSVKSGGITLEAEHAKLGTEVASLMQDTEAIRKLLADPRLKSDDPTIKAEREQLQRIYDAQQARSAPLSELMLRESTAMSKDTVGFEDPLMWTSAQIPRDPQKHPTPVSTTPPNQPLLIGVDAADKAALDAWSGTHAKTVHDAEEQAAKSFLPLAQGCR